MKRGSAGGKATAVILRMQALNNYYKDPNLVGLCPTHHWELDNGYLKKEELL